MGVFLLDETLVLANGRQTVVVPRGMVGELRPPQVAHRLNREEKRTGKRRHKPGLRYRDTDGGEQMIELPSLPASWWARFEAGLEQWRVHGHAPELPVEIGFADQLRSWLPSLGFMHLLLLLLLLMGAALTLLAGLVLGGENGFLAGFIVGLPMMFIFPVLLIRLMPVLHRRWAFIPREIDRKISGYALLLGVFATIGTIGVAHQSATWLLATTAQRLPDVALESALRYAGQNVLLGLPDGIVDASRYGAFQPRVPRAGTYGRHSEPGGWHYVTRLSSRADPRTCIYLGAVQDRATEATHKRSTAARVLHEAQFYREPLFLTERSRGYWQRAIDALEGDGPRCRSMVVEPIDDPEMLIAAEWAQIGFLIVLMHVVPLLLLLGWCYYRVETDWR